MTALLKTRLEVFPLFLLLVCFQDLGGVFNEIALPIGIRDTYINDAICAASPKAVNKYVSAKLISVLCKLRVTGGLA
jgi:hypothetical protein